MTEKELFNALRSYLHEKDSDSINHTVSFLIITVSETEDTVTVGSSHIDPKMPDTIQGIPINLSIPQQTLIYFKRGMKKLIIEAKDVAIALSEVNKRMGVEKMQEVVNNSSNAQEFNDNLSKALKEIGDDIEKHGTG